MNQLFHEIRDRIRVWFHWIGTGAAEFSRRLIPWQHPRGRRPWGFYGAILRSALLYFVLAGIAVFFASVFGLNDTLKAILGIGWLYFLLTLLVIGAIVAVPILAVAIWILGGGLERRLEAAAGEEAGRIRSALQDFRASLKKSWDAYRGFAFWTVVGLLSILLYTMIVPLHQRVGVIPKLAVVAILLVVVGRRLGTGQAFLSFAFLVGLIAFAVWTISAYFPEKEAKASTGTSAGTKQASPYPICSGDKGLPVILTRESVPATLRLRPDCLSREVVCEDVGVDIVGASDGWYEYHLADGSIVFVEREEEFYFERPLVPRFRLRGEGLATVKAILKEEYYNAPASRKKKVERPREEGTPASPPAEADCETVTPLHLGDYEKPHARLDFSKTTCVYVVVPLERHASLRAPGFRYRPKGQAEFETLTQDVLEVTGEFELRGQGKGEIELLDAETNSSLTTFFKTLGSNPGVLF